MTRQSNKAAWPKLSETLPGKTPGECQRCAAAAALTYWQEHDEQDQPLRAFVVLCQPCADKIIEPHPRLYRELPAVQPMPGVMPICLDCVHRTELSCTCPAAMFNGGPRPGLTFEPPGQMIHVCRAPRSKSGWIYCAPGPVTACSGKVPFSPGSPSDPERRNP